MKPTDLEKSLEALININSSVFLWGAPGVGKSDLVHKVAEKTGRKLIDIRAVLRDTVDLRGVPSIENGRTCWNVPEEYPDSKSQYKYIIFWDELNAAPPLVQAVIYQAILENKIGDYNFPVNTCHIAAGNRDTDRAVTSRMSSALANRFRHLDFEVHNDDWIAWALENGISTEYIAFIRYRPELLHNFDPKKNEKAFPTPRSNVEADKVLQLKLEPHLEYEIIKGTTGEGHAAELMGFMKIARSLVSPDVILMNPETAEVPKDPATLYALCGALARKASDQTINNLVKYADRLPAEFSVLMIRDSLRYEPTLVSTRAFIEWSSKNSEVLI